MEFLYSLNRLNVATSRAQCLAVAALIRVRCRTPRQMRLANALARLVEVAGVARHSGSNHGVARAVSWDEGNRRDSRRAALPGVVVSTRTGQRPQECLYLVESGVEFSTGQMRGSPGLIGTNRGDRLLVGQGREELRELGRARAQNDASLLRSRVRCSESLDWS